MTTTWFTSDLHFKHRFVAGLRGHDDVNEHDNEIIDHWHNAVDKKDTVFILGDLCMGGTQKWNDVLSTIQNLPGERKHLVIGNHEPIFAGMGMRSMKKWFKPFTEVFDTIQPFVFTKWNKTEVLMSHFPYQGDGEGTREMEERHTQYRLPNMGQWLLHGHTHADTLLSGPKSLHVGWDVDRRFFNVEELKAIVEAYDA